MSDIKIWKGWDYENPQKTKRKEIIHRKEKKKVELGFLDFDFNEGGGKEGIRKEEKNQESEEEEEEDHFNFVYLEPGFGKVGKESSQERYTTLKILGIGRNMTRKIELVKDNEDGRCYVRKTFSKSLFRGSIENWNERNSHREKEAESELTQVVKKIYSIDHPNIVKLRRTTQNDDNLFLFFDYIPLDHLLQDSFNYIDQKNKKTTNRSINNGATEVIAQISSVIGCLHKNELFKDQFKPEEFIRDEFGDFVFVGLPIFRLRKYYDPGPTCFQPSPVYKSPEHILGLISFGKNEDLRRMSNWWNFGCIVHEMIYVNPPFYSEDHYEICHSIVYSEVKFSKQQQKNADKNDKIIFDDSSKLEDLLTKLLNKDPRRRIGFEHGFEEIRKHPFFENVVDWDRMIEKRMKKKLISDDIFFKDENERVQFLKENNIICFQRKKESREDDDIYQSMETVEIKMFRNDSTLFVLRYLLF